MTNTDQIPAPSEHTPGPWRIRRLTNGWPIITSLTDCWPVITGDGHDIADLRLNGKGLQHVEANAGLIAAAPAQSIVLDLLQHGLATIDAGELEFDGVMYWFDDRRPAWAALVDAIGWDHARAAIAKAMAKNAGGGV